ncbi:hypothetical protein E0Z10_g6902 [Xylaria hypoxylon]|uniref:Uncharacterized protein n=1 Tax=Xylaria hypoxylon TaxID=37992 RepID=A0A4Z0YTV6_9PEZI|nr:hypothetical protein E0Z10_g6902 [Xylaria hypoxylon]
MSGSHPASVYCQIDKTSFFTISDDEKVLHLVRDQFAQELERLKRAYSITNPNATLPSTASPSQILFGSQFDEVNRTLVGLIALRWIYNDQYDTFRGAQPDAVALTRESFNWMRHLFKAGLQSDDDFTALLTSIVINDLGKDPQLASDYRAKTGEDISAQNHDRIVLKAAEAGLVPSLNRLPREHKDDILRSMKLGAELNFGQLAQAENVPVCLTSLFELRGHPRVFELCFMEQLLDIAGASGHEDWTCANHLIQPLLESYRNVYDAAQATISGGMEPRDAYNLILVRRSQLLRDQGFRQLEIVNPNDRALTRLLCMGRATDLSTAQLYDSVWGDLEPEIKDSLVADLNVDGSVDRPAVQATYAPALLTKGVDASGPGSSDEKRRRLQSLLRYLARVLKPASTPLNSSAVVIERSVLMVAQYIAESDEFRANPAILDEMEVADSVVAQTARGV